MLNLESPWTIADDVEIPIEEALCDGSNEIFSFPNTRWIAQKTTAPVWNAQHDELR
jgi:hypothetical protein